jgi:hypothetical protein
MIQRLDDAPTQVQRDQSSYGREWRNFVNVNGKTMFQIALLLSGDACAAEEALINGVDKLNVSRPPEPDDLAIWEKTVVMRSIEMSDTSSSAACLHAQSMLRPELLPVIRIEQCPRICFVLRLLLGYSATSCAQMLDIDESEIPLLLQKAAIQIQQGTS